MANAPAFPDHFSGHARAYAAHRPTYPAALLDWAASQAPRHDAVWDVGAGNGQASSALAERFALVHATDASAAQIAMATPHPRVRYAVAPAEASGLPDRCVDAATVAQALHWFRPAEFFAEVRRVVRPGGVLVAWAYDLHRVGPGIDEVLRRLQDDFVGPCWPPERRHVYAGYRDLPWPFDELAAPAFELTAAWTLPQMLAYMNTWSAAQRYAAAHGHSAIDAVADDLAAAWGDPERVRTVVWPVHLRAGRVA